MFLYVLIIDCIACADGTYGLECNEVCGHCKIKTNCHYANGTCLGGCEPGFLGDLCKTCKFITMNSFKKRYRNTATVICQIIFLQTCRKER